MSPDPKEDSIAEKLEGTKWEYSQSEDRRFLFDPIGWVFGTFRWDGKSRARKPSKSNTPDAADRDHGE